MLSKMIWIVMTYNKCAVFFCTIWFMVKAFSTYNSYSISIPWYNSTANSLTNYLERDKLYHDCYNSYQIQMLSLNSTKHTSSNIT